MARSFLPHSTASRAFSLNFSRSVVNFVTCCFNDSIDDSSDAFSERH